MATVNPTNDVNSEVIADFKVEKIRRQDSLLSTAIRRLRTDYLTLGALAILILLAIVAIGAPVAEQIFGVSYTSVAQGTAGKLLPMGSPNHPLGTDNLGRDMLARLLYGGRVSLFVAASAALFSSVIGVTLGLFAGYYQGGRYAIIDDVLMWFITTVTSIPTLLLLILLTSVFSPNLVTLIAILTFISWTGTMRLIRGETLSQRENEYVISARAMGANPLRIMFVHILPNTLSILITDLAIGIGTLILVESALSFLGLGVRPPEPSWGNMLTEAQAYFRQGAHMSILPGPADRHHRTQPLPSG